MCGIYYGGADMTAKPYRVTPEDIISYAGGEGNAEMVHDLACLVADLINLDWETDVALTDIIAWLECHGSEEDAS